MFRAKVSKVTFSLFVIDNEQQEVCNLSQYGFRCCYLRLNHFIKVFLPDQILWVKRVFRRGLWERGVKESNVDTESRV